MRTLSLNALCERHGLPAEPACTEQLVAVHGDAAHGLASSAADSDVAGSDVAAGNAGGGAGMAAARGILVDFASGMLNTQAIATELTAPAGLVLERELSSLEGLLFAVRPLDDLTISAQHQGGGGLLHDGDSAELYLHLHPGDSAALRTEAGTVLLAADGGGRARLWRLPPPATLEVEEFAVREVRVAAWLRAHDPGWLTALVHDSDASGDPLRQLCAAGTLHRLRPPSDPQAELEALLRGEGDSSPVATWASALTQAQRAPLIDLGRVALETLLDDLEAMDQLDLSPQAIDPAETLDPAEILALLHMRDELEGARVLLALPSGESGLERLFCLADRVGARLLRCLDLSPLGDDALLACVHRVSPDLWWANAWANSRSGAELP